MAYDLIILPKAEKELKKIPKRHFLKIDKAILMLAEEPRPTGCKKLQGYETTYRIRIGDYRIVCRIEDERLFIEAIRIGNRKDVYRK